MTSARDEVTVAPILPSRDFETTWRFYEALGFRLLAQYQPPDAYLILRREAVELHFFPAPGFEPTTSYAGCYVRLDAVDSWFEAFSRAALPREGIPRLMPLADRRWGMREFALIDPDGSLLRFGADLATQS